MYIPEKYRQENPEEIRRFIRANAFGILVSSGPEGPLATHIPLELEPSDEATNSGSNGNTGAVQMGKGAGIAGDRPLVLAGHFARANPQWQTIRDGQEVLCIFHGPHSYVSSSWYREEEVPTWNYMAVHVRGTYRVQSHEELMASLRNLVDTYEKGSENPVSLDNLSARTLRQSRGVVGFTVTANRVEAAYKLSQGREADHPRITHELERRGGLSAAVANEMKRCPHS